MTDAARDGAAPDPSPTDPPAPTARHPAAPNPLAMIAPLARRLLWGERASLLLPHNGLDVLRIVSASGLPDTVVAQAQVRLGEPIAGLVAQTRQPLLGSDPAVTHGDRVGYYRTGSFVSVPVPLGDGQYGVLSVADPRDRATFRAADVEALQGLAALVAHYISGTVPREAVRRQLIQAREEERGRVARELHDDAGHALTAAIFRLDLDALRLGDDPLAAHAAIERARAALLESAALLHDATYTLRPRILDDLGLLAALRSLLERAEEGDRRVTMSVTGEPRRLDEARELAVFRVVQEALTNVRKHARAAQTWVWLRFEAAWLTVIVEDDGIGLDPAAVPTPGPSSSLGLAGMRERVEVLGGALTIGARPHGGTRLVAHLPL